jgi:two-component system response regulator MprA
MKAERAGQDIAPALRGERLLVVDDDPDVRASLERALRCAGYAVTTAVHGADALDALARAPVDLIVLDVLMPMVDGFDACRRLRARGDATPILVLTARDAVDDRVAGLAAGADDYLVKPFALRELLARVQALLRRSRIGRDVLGYADLTLDVTARRLTRGDRVIELTRTEFGLLELLARVQALLRRSRIGRDVLGYADLTLDVTARRLTRGDRVIELTRTEFGLLELLLRNAEQVISYDVIRERVWGYGEAPASNALQVFVGFLRRKLEDGGGPRLLHNVRGVGYVIRTAP